MRSFRDFLNEITIVQIPKDADIMRQLDQTLAMLSQLEPSRVSDHKSKIIDLNKMCDGRLSGF